MKIFTCNSFRGRWPVGTAAVVVAEGLPEAELLLMEKLIALGLPQKEKLELIELPLENPQAVILNDGDY